MKRRFFAFLTACVLLLSAIGLAACSGTTNRDNPTPAPGGEMPTAAPGTTVPTDGPDDTAAPDGALLFFENGLDSVIHSLYISPSSDTEWGMPVCEYIEPGDTVAISFSDNPLRPNEPYDIGIVDEDGYNYDGMYLDLVYGATIKIVGDNGGATMTVTAGGMNEQVREIDPYLEGEDPSADKVVMLSPVIAETFDYSYDSELSRTFVTLNFDCVTLENEEADAYPGLLASLDEMNDSIRELAYELYGELGEEAEQDFRSGNYADDDYFMPYSVGVRAYVHRADNRFFSVLYEVELDRNEYATYRYIGYNFDSSGFRHNLSDLLYEPFNLYIPINEQLEPRNEDGFLLDENKDYTEYWEDVDCEDYAFTLDYYGISLIFNHEAFGIEEAYLDSVTLTFSEYPDLVEEDYMMQPEKYAVSFPWGTTVYVDIDGETMPIFAGGLFEDGCCEALYAACGEALATEQVTAFGIDPVYIHSGSDDYLYVKIDTDNDYQYIIVFELSPNGVVKQDEIDAGFVVRYFDFEDGDLPVHYFYPIVDPDCFELSTSTDVLCTVRGIRSYYVGENGMPEAIDEYYFLLETFILTLNRELLVYDPEGDGYIELPAGTNLEYFATDSESVCFLRSEDGDVYTVEADCSEYPHTIDGVDIDDIFTGLVFAG